MADGGGRKWLAYGCFGCLALVGLGLILGAVLFGTAYMGVRSEDISEQVLTHEIPPTEGAAPGDSEGNSVPDRDSGEAGGQLRPEHLPPDT